jgi:hypothetical protein
MIIIQHDVGRYQIGLHEGAPYCAATVPSSAQCLCDLKLFLMPDPPHSTKDI